jgi:hypothetical protein
VGKLFDDYRPELHYMRGPGPRWHEKHDGVSAPATEEQHELNILPWLVPAATAAMLGLMAVVALA